MLKRKGILFLFIQSDARVSQCWNYYVISKDNNAQDENA